MAYIGFKWFENFYQQRAAEPLNQLSLSSRIKFSQASVVGSIPITIITAKPCFMRKYQAIAGDCNPGTIHFTRTTIGPKNTGWLFNVQCSAGRKFYFFI